MSAEPRTTAVTRHMKRLFVWLLALAVCALVAWLAVPGLAGFPV